MTTIRDLDGIEVEHLLGQTYGPLVKLRCLSAGTILVGEVTPGAAREIAAHLAEAAARAEYEADLFHAMQAAEFDARVIGGVLTMVRAGEIHRHTNQGGPDGDHT